MSEYNRRRYYCRHYREISEKDLLKIRVLGENWMEDFDRFIEMGILFNRLPYELIFHISGFCEDKPLFNFMVTCKNHLKWFSTDEKEFQKASIHFWKKKFRQKYPKLNLNHPSIIKKRNGMALERFYYNLHHRLIYNEEFEELPLLEGVFDSHRTQLLKNSSYGDVLVTPKKMENGKFIIEIRNTVDFSVIEEHENIEIDRKEYFKNKIFICENKPNSLIFMGLRFLYKHRDHRRFIFEVKCPSEIVKKETIRSLSVHSCVPFRRSNIIKMTDSIFVSLYCKLKARDAEELILEEGITITRINQGGVLFSIKTCKEGEFQIQSIFRRNDHQVCWVDENEKTLSTFDLNKMEITHEYVGRNYELIFPLNNSQERKDEILIGIDTIDEDTCEEVELMQKQAELVIFNLEKMVEKKRIPLFKEHHDYMFDCPDYKQNHRIDDIYGHICCSQINGDYLYIKRKYEENPKMKPFMKDYEDTYSFRVVYRNCSDHEVDIPSEDVIWKKSWIYKKFSIFALNGGRFLILSSSREMDDFNEVRKCTKCFILDWSFNNSKENIMGYIALKIQKWKIDEERLKLKYKYEY